ncbi:MAG: hypothetical protein WC711_04210 [Candidatus Staskawiczbacteria bacterium]|jgi:hypothetical protein
MGAMDLNKAVVGTFSDSSYSNPTKDTDFYSGNLIDTDGVTISESSWTVEWAKWHGFYDDIAIFSAIIDALTCWTVGKGFKGKDAEKLKKITGWKKDDINSIFDNLLRVCLIGGDSHAEIMRDKAGRLTNLKPLNPGTIKQTVNSSGILQKYEQTTSKQTWQAKEIFHLSWNRLADEIHGKPEAHRVEEVIKQIKQLQEDLAIRFHRVIKPLRLFKANTDDAATLAETEVKLKAGYKNCEVIVIPDKTLEEAPSNPIPSAQDALIYLDYLTRNLVSSCGVPEVILGWSAKSTEASSKIVYLAFQQRIEKIQRFLEEQIRLQLGLEIEFEFPASLEEGMTTPPVTGTIGESANAPTISTPMNDIKKKGEAIKV